MITFLFSVSFQDNWAALPVISRSHCMFIPLKDGGEANDRFESGLSLRFNIWKCDEPPAAMFVATKNTGVFNETLGQVQSHLW